MQMELFGKRIGLGDSIKINIVGVLDENGHIEADR